jgi:hypothetical protein
MKGLKMELVERIMQILGVVKREDALDVLEEVYLEREQLRSELRDKEAEIVRLRGALDAQEERAYFARKPYIIKGKDTE